MKSWHIVTGEYPPQPGGISDYTRLVARGLAEAGDEVHVWSTACDAATPDDAGVNVHRLAGNFGPSMLLRLKVGLSNFPRPRRLLVQYVPQAYGLKGMNLAFCLWLLARRRDSSIWTMFHEVYFPISRKQSVSYNILGAVTRVMASLVARASERIFVSIPAWEDLLKPLADKHAQISWLPVPSSIPVVDDEKRTEAIRALCLPAPDGQILGHFGTYGRSIAEMLIAVLPSMLIENPLRAALLLGRGGEVVRGALIARHENLRGRIHATGSLDAAEVSLHLRACDVMLQPFVDGVSTRRTSVMACLAHGLPVVTNAGDLTEDVWSESRAVALTDGTETTAMIAACEALLDDEAEMVRLRQAATAFYLERFDVRHTISRLRESLS